MHSLILKITCINSKSGYIHKQNQQIQENCENMDNFKFDSRHQSQLQQQAQAPKSQSNPAQYQYRLHTEHSQSQSHSISKVSISKQLPVNGGYIDPPPLQQYHRQGLPENKPRHSKPVAAVTQVDLGSILKQMTREQIDQLLSDPEVANILQTRPQITTTTQQKKADDDSNFTGYNQPPFLRPKLHVKQINNGPSETTVGEGEVNFDNMQVNTTGSSDELNLAFQLFDGEVMDVQMANFMGIHMLNDITDPTRLATDPDQQDHQLDSQYQDPVTGCHFEYNDLVRRIKILQKRRAIIDEAIREEIKEAKRQKGADKVHLTDGDEMCIPSQNVPKLLIQQPKQNDMLVQPLKQPANLNVMQQKQPVQQQRPIVVQPAQNFIKKKASQAAKPQNQQLQVLKKIINEAEYQPQQQQQILLQNKQQKQHYRHHSYETQPNQQQAQPHQRQVTFDFHQNQQQFYTQDSTYPQQKQPQKHGVLTLTKGQAKLQFISKEMQINNFFQPMQQQELLNVLNQKKKISGIHARGNTFDNRSTQVEQRPISSSSKTKQLKKQYSNSQLSPKQSTKQRKQSAQKPPSNQQQQQQVQPCRPLSKRQPQKILSSRQEIISKVTKPQDDRQKVKQSFNSFNEQIESIRFSQQTQQSVHKPPAQKRGGSLKL